MQYRLLPKRAQSDRRTGLAAARRSPREMEIIGLRSVSEATVYAHVFANADREVGGVLIGRMPADGSLPMVTGAIPAVSADERRATLTFTQDTWAHVHRTLDTKFPPDEQIVGWYHSHPGFGIFLSGHDLFIHENFFSSPSQIAVVVDPHARTEGAFVWREQKLFTLFERPTPDRWTAARPTHDLPGTPRGVVTPALGPEKLQTPLLTLLIAAVIGVLLGLGAWCLFLEGTGTGTPRTVRNTVTTKSHTAAQSHGGQQVGTSEQRGSQEQR